MQHEVEARCNGVQNKRAKTDWSPMTNNGNMGGEDPHRWSTTVVGSGTGSHQGSSPAAAAGSEKGKE